MKKALILLSLIIVSCDAHSPQKKETHLKLCFLGGHARNITVDLPADAQLFLRPDPLTLCWRSDNSWCGGHVVKYNVIDFEMVNSK